jgi:2-phosphosulfolactate phosphatase
MKPAVEVLLTPVELGGLAARDLSQTTCVVFDVLRATSTMITALAHGAEAIVPVAEIRDALALRAQRPEVLLAGEREGRRIRADQTGGIDFDLGNSPREFTAAVVRARTIVMTTTNGTRALRACAHARRVLAGAFLNLGALAAHLRASPPERLLLVCSGTVDGAALEDTLAAGALCDLLGDSQAVGQLADSAWIARSVYRAHAHDLLGAVGQARNGRRLLAMPDLAPDVPWCVQRDRFELVPVLTPRGVVAAG